MRLTLLYGALLAVTIFASREATATQAGFRVESFEDTNRSRPVILDWWYPVRQQAAAEINYGLGRGRVVEAGKIVAGKFPLILMSHGAFGSARNYSWIAEHLARSGFLVAGVSHHGESYVYGENSIDPQSVLRWWERPMDISAAITYIERSSTLASAVDRSRIGFVGHSSGGATAMSLLGASYEAERMGDYCSSKESSADRGCDYGRSDTDAVSNNITQPTETNYADGRIRAFVALDPALGPGFVDFTAIKASMKVLLVGSVNNDFLPFEHHAQRLAAKLPNATPYWLSEQEGHFVYLNECGLPLKANGVPLCTDRPGVSRATVHAKLRRQITDFFSRALSTESRLPEPENSDNTQQRPR